MPEFRCSCGHHHRGLASLLISHPLPWSYDIVETIIDATGSYVPAETAMNAVNLFATERAKPFVMPDMRIRVMPG